MHCSYLSKCSTLQVISSSRFFSFGIHRIIATESSRNIHSTRTWHTISTSGAADLHIFLNLSFYFFDQLLIRFCKTSTSDSLAVFTFCSTSPWNSCRRAHRSLPAGRKAISTQLLPECDVFHPCGITLSQIPGEGSPDVRHEAAP